MTVGNYHLKAKLGDCESDEKLCVMCGVGLCVCTLHSLSVCLFGDASPKVWCLSLCRRKEGTSLMACGTSCEVAARQDRVGKANCSALVMHTVFWQAMTFRIPAALWMATLT